MLSRAISYEKGDKMNCKKGQSLVEFALVLPILILLLIGMLEFGRLFNSYMVLLNLSREGARYAATGESDMWVQSYLSQKAVVLDGENLNIFIQPEESSRKRGEPVCVRLELYIPLYTPVFNSFMPNPFHIVAETTMRVE